MKRFILSPRHQAIHDALISYVTAVVGRSPKTAKDYTETLERYLPRFMNDRMGITSVQSIYDVDDMDFLQLVHDKIIANKEWADFNRKAHASTFTSGLKRYIDFYKSSYFPFETNSEADRVGTSDIPRVEKTDELKEGRVYESHSVGFERNPKARQACLDHYGYKCCVCGFDFEATYGEIGKEFIEVHHVVPVSCIRESYVVDPIRDLRPVCSNCHSMLHRHNPVLSIEELRKMLKKM